MLKNAARTTCSPTGKLKVLVGQRMIADQGADDDRIFMLHINSTLFEHNQLLTSKGTAYYLGCPGFYLSSFMVL